MARFPFHFYLDPPFFIINPIVSNFFFFFFFIVSNFDPIHTVPSRALCWEGDLTGQFWEFIVSDNSSSLDLNCRPLRSPDVGLGKPPPTFNCFCNLAHGTSQWISVGDTGALFFPDMTDAYLFLSNSSHTDADITSSLGALGRLSFPFLNLWVYHITYFCCKYGPWGFWCYAVAQICGNSEKFRNVLLLPPSSLHPFSPYIPANLEKVKRCHSLTVS